MSRFVEMADEKHESRRSYRGKAPEDRSAERRDRFLSAGLQLFGTQGYASTTVKALCTEAGLTERYFYESFQNREELFLAVAGHAAAGLMAALVEARRSAERTPAAQADAILDVFFRWFRTDPRRARVQLFEPHLIGPNMSSLYRDVTALFNALLKENILEWYADALAKLALDPDLLATALVGGAIEIVKDWVLGGFEKPIEDMVRNTRFLLGALTEGLERHAPASMRREPAGERSDAPFAALFELGAPDTRRR